MHKDEVLRLRRTHSRASKLIHKQTMQQQPEVIPKVRGHSVGKTPLKTLPMDYSRLPLVTTLGPYRVVRIGKHFTWIDARDGTNGERFETSEHALTDIRQRILGTIRRA